jgi:nucleoside-diphosphate-sugar epimerase
MKALVIGGTRFLGYHLVRRLLKEGIEVVLFNRGISPDDFGENVGRVFGDRNSYNKFFNTFRNKKFDIVVDLIGYDRDGVESAVKTFKGNIGQYIFISTGQVYLVTKNEQLPATEKDYYQDVIECPSGEEAAYSYGIKKRECEDFLDEAYKFQHFPSVRFRCPIIHGERDYTLRLYSYLIRLMDGNPLITPEGSDIIIRHVYVGDVVNAILNVFQAEQTRGMVYNLASEEILVLSELLQLASKVVEIPLTLHEIPLSILKQNKIPTEISPFSGRWVSYLDPSLAREEINFKSTPINQWLSRTIHWFMHEYDGPQPENYLNRSKEISLAQSWQKKKG